jgi:type VI secretion system protein ImpF
MNGRLVMAKSPAGQPLVPSLLDRLLSERRGAKSLRHIRQYVATDLEDLLNTRRRCEPVPGELQELGTSLVQYGLPDFTGVKMSNSAEKARLRRLLEDTITRYESRLSSVRVTLVENADPADNRLHFRIEATLNTQPAPEPVVFDSSLEPSTSTFEVS